MSALSFAVLCALPVSGCGSDDQDVNRFFETAPYGKAACDEPNGKLEGRREIHLFVSANADVATASKPLQRYYQRYGLKFFTKAGPTHVKWEYVLDTDSAALNAALTKEFPGVDFNDEAALMADPVLYDRVVTFAANLMLRPVREFAEAHGHAGTNVTNLIVLPDIERPNTNSMLGGPGAELVGLALSPALLAVFAARQDLQEGRVWKNVDLAPDFTPMMFISSNALTKIAKLTTGELADILTAHEFGHTGALSHREILHNLMYPSVSPGEDGCANALEDDQIATMRATLGFTPLMQALRVSSPVEKAVPSARDLFPPAQLGRMLHGDDGAKNAFLNKFIRSAQ